MALSGGGTFPGFAGGIFFPGGLCLDIREKHNAYGDHQDPNKQPYGQTAFHI